MFIVSPTTVWNPAALETRGIPKRMLGRIAVLPRRGADPATWARIIFEAQLLRFTAALAPFIAAMFIWPRMALPIAQAPVVMVFVVGFFEMKVLRVAKDRRETLMTEADAGRVLDLLRFRATAVLTRIAARHPDRAGLLHLVVEQSELARVTPLTLVSVQSDTPAPALLDLDAADRAVIAEGLFGGDLTERALHLANMRENAFVRDVAFDTRGVSAHARLSAIMAEAAEPAAPREARA
jgi:hypothetical protein